MINMISSSKGERILKYIISDTFDLSEKNAIILLRDNWDDYCYRTSFNAIYNDSNGLKRSLGTLKIGKEGASATLGSPFSICCVLPASFSELPDGAFSLWQSADAYSNVKKLGDELNINIFQELNDIAYNLGLLDRYRLEEIMVKSLLRSIGIYTIENQFHRITLGMAKLTSFSFAYEINKNQKFEALTFDVLPNSFPPSNVHALIAGNGVGKSTLIKDMIACICDVNSDNNRGRLVYDEVDKTAGHFANVICVNFSPFDDSSFAEKYDKSIFTYIGVKKEYNSNNYEDCKGEINLLDDIKQQFLESLKVCLSNITKYEDLCDVIGILENDPMFYDYQMSKLLKLNSRNLGSLVNLFDNIFSQMSSGHKVVLSIIVRCIDKMVEKTIIFFDEPENHLHPPLLSSLIRAISLILTKRNGVAIISTHSPIVLQETPKACVWQLSRKSDIWDISRPRFETFGENIGTLTNDVFNFEINGTGFHDLIKKSVIESDTYEKVIEKYDGQLGDEARGIVRVLFKQKERGEL